MSVKPWKNIGEPNPVSKNYYGKQLVHQVVEDPNGKRHDFYFYTLHDSVVALPVTTDGKVLAVREYKQGNAKVQVGLVGGYLDRGESYAEATIREIKEETGHTPGRLVDLGDVFIIPRHSSGKVRFFLALNCEPSGDQQLDENEGNIEVVPMPLKDWIARTENGQTRETFSVCATMRALPHLRKIKKFRLY